jgi:hypothetical protein
VRSGADRARQCGSLGLIGAGMPWRSPLSTMGTFRNLSEVTADATAAIRCYERSGWRQQRCGELAESDPANGPLCTGIPDDELGSQHGLRRASILSALGQRFELRGLSKSGMEGLLSRGLPCDFRAMSLLSEDESHGTTDDLSLLDGGSDWYSRVLPHDADSSGSCLGLKVCA